MSVDRRARIVAKVLEAITRADENPDTSPAYEAMADVAVTAVARAIMEGS